MRINRRRFREADEPVDQILDPTEQDDDVVDPLEPTEQDDDVVDPIEPSEQDDEDPEAQVESMISSVLRGKPVRRVLEHSIREYDADDPRWGDLLAHVAPKLASFLKSNMIRQKFTKEMVGFFDRFDSNRQGLKAADIDKALVSLNNDFEVPTFVKPEVEKFVNAAAKTWKM